MRPAHQFLKSAFASPPELARLLRSGPSPKKTPLIEYMSARLPSPPQPPASPPTPPPLLRYPVKPGPPPVPTPRPPSGLEGLQAEMRRSYRNTSPVIPPMLRR